MWESENKIQVKKKSKIERIKDELVEYHRVTGSDRSKVPNPQPLLCTHGAAVGPNNGDKWFLTAHYKASRLSWALCVLKDGEGHAAQRDTQTHSGLFRIPLSTPIKSLNSGHFGKYKSIEFLLKIKWID